MKQPSGKNQHRVREIVLIGLFTVLVSTILMQPNVLVAPVYSALKPGQCGPHNCEDCTYNECYVFSEYCVFKYDTIIDDTKQGVEKYQDVAYCEKR